MWNVFSIHNQVHESPAEFAAVVKKNALLQLSKWEIDRAALVALAERAGDEAAVAAKMHEAERADLSAHALRLEEHLREMELDRERIAKEAETVTQERYLPYRRIFLCGNKSMHSRENCGVLRTLAMWAVRRSPGKDHMQPSNRQALTE